MKKLFMSMVMAIMLVVGSNAFACPNGDCNEGQVATGDYSAFAADHAYSYSHTINDFGQAGGFYGIGADLETYASSDDYKYELRIVGWERVWFFYVPIFKKFQIDPEVFQQGLIYGESETKAWSWAKDYGLTSKAGAGIKAEDGFIITEGSAFGEDGCKEFVKSRITFGADFYQKNLAQEVGYDAGGVVAGNQSGLKFSASTPWEVTEHKDVAIQVNGSSYTPDVITKGKSEVTIDPYGNTRSIQAHTENMANLAFTGCRVPEVTMNDASVFGNGFVDGVISNGVAYGQGTATFKYEGYTSGSGQADLSVVVKDQGAKTSVFVKGSSSATANMNVPN